MADTTESKGTTRTLGVGVCVRVGVTISVMTLGASVLVLAADFVGRTVFAPVHHRIHRCVVLHYATLAESGRVVVE